MSDATRQRLYGFRHAFDHRVTLVLFLVILAMLLLAPLLMWALRRGGKIDAKLGDELTKRYNSWLVLVPLMTVPVLLGALWTILAVGMLSILCYREYARATGLFREKLISLMVGVGIIAVTFAVLDNWYALFTALWPLRVGTITAVAILEDRPQGYIQRVALGVLAFMLFGACLGHLGYFANDTHFRPILFWLVVCVEMNDVFAYITGKTFGRRKLMPHTSPNKTVGGFLGALLLTTALAAGVGHFVFRGEVIDRWGRLLLLGAIISVVGDLSDLLISSIKRDLDIKDMGTLFPGHGGLLDRFDSLILVAPAVFHYVGYFRGVGLDQPARILSGSW